MAAAGPSDYAPLEKAYHETSKERFYLYRYKTAYCPRQSVKHDMSNCLYAHWVYDYRRAPDLHNYVPEICPLVSPDRGGVCKDGDKCAYSHSPLEKLYHPFRYKVFPCENTRKGIVCTRREFCAFYHSESERRNPDTLKCGLNNEQNFCQPQPRVPYISVASNYFEVMTPKTTLKELESVLIWSNLELVKAEKSTKIKDSASESGAEHKRPRRWSASSLGHSQPFFATFANSPKEEMKKMLYSHATTHTSEPTEARMFIDENYIDSSDALDSEEDLDNDPQAGKFCESIVNTASGTVAKRLVVPK
jgi:hypothetical protein